MRHPESFEVRVEPSTLRVTAIMEFSPLDWVDFTIAATTSTLYIANHHNVDTFNAYD